MRKLLIILVSSFEDVICHTPIQPDLASRSPEQRYMISKCTYEMSKAGVDLSSGPTADPEREGSFKYLLGEIFRTEIDENRFDACLTAWCETTMELVKVYETGDQGVPGVSWGGLKWPSGAYGRKWQIYHLLEAAIARLRGEEIQANALADDMYPVERQAIWNRLKVKDQCPGEVLRNLITKELEFHNL
jgi:hypothetical protein